MSEAVQVCPLCGGPNSCAVAQYGRDEAPCWCRSVVIDKSLIARVPAELRGKSCLCPHCVGVAATTKRTNT